MANIPSVRVESLWFPLVKKFYQAYYPSGKPNKADPIWVIKQGATIISAVRLKQFEHSQLLTALVTHPDYRQQGYAYQLMSDIKTEFQRPTYCFNTPELIPFYQKCHFFTVAPEHLPAEFASRLKRYQIKQPSLIAMKHQQSTVT